MIPTRFHLATLLSCCLAVNCCSQNISSDLPNVDVFVGSTPCDDLIKSSLGIPAESTCEFIKWELSLSESKNDPAVFQLTVLYGESQPNTNGFKGGGKKIEAAGKYTVNNKTNERTHLNVYNLHSEKFTTSLFLIQMDDNILHFADSAKKFIVGNGGFGYVLNRMESH